MPKVKASLVDVSTEFVPIEPGPYEWLIKGKPDYKNNGGREVVTITLAVDQPGDFVGRTVKDQIHLHKRDGTDNEYGQKQLKLYYEAAFGADVVASWSDDDYDTDRLEGQRVAAETYIDQFEEKKKNPDGTYSDEPVLDPATGEPKVRKTNKIQNVVPIS